MNVFAINIPRKVLTVTGIYIMHHIYILYIYTYIFIPSTYIYINAYLYTYKCISVCKKETHVQTDMGQAELSECATEMTFHPEYSAMSYVITGPS